MSKRIAVQLTAGLVLLALGGVALSGLFREQLFGTSEPEAIGRVDASAGEGAPDAAALGSRTPVRLASADAPAGSTTTDAAKGDAKKPDGAKTDDGKPAAKLPESGKPNDKKPSDQPPAAGKTGNKANSAGDAAKDGKATPTGGSAAAGKNGAGPREAGVKPPDAKVGAPKPGEGATLAKPPTDKSTSDKSAADKGAIGKSGTDKSPGGKKPNETKTGPEAKAAAAPSTPRRDDPIVESCTVVVINDVNLSAGEAGLLDVIKVKEGDTIKPGDELGSIDKREPELRKRVKTLEYQTAKEEADTDVEERFAIATRDFYQAGLEKKLEANRRTKDTITEIEIFESRLGVEKSDAQIEQAQLKHRVAGLTAESKQAEIEAPELSIDQRTIRSRLDGEGKVIEIFKRKGEWVTLGEPVFHVMQLDRLRIKGYVDAGVYDRRDIVGRPVTVRIETPRGREEFKGQLVFANYNIESGNRYLAFAEIENRRDGSGDWVLSAGMTATMTIHLK